MPFGAGFHLPSRLFRWGMLSSNLLKKVWLSRGCLFLWRVSVVATGKPVWSAHSKYSLCFIKCLGGGEAGGSRMAIHFVIKPFYYLTNCSMSLCRSGSKISEQNIASRRNNNNSKLKIKQKKITETQRHHLQGTKIKQRHNIWVATSASKASIYCSQTKTLLNKAPRY